MSTAAQNVTAAFLLSTGDRISGILKKTIWRELVWNGRENAMLMNSNEYLNIVESIKQEIRTVQYRAMVSVNR